MIVKNNNNNIYLLEIEKLKSVKNEYNNIFNNNCFLEYNDVYNTINKILPQKLEFKIKYILNFISYKKYLKAYNSLLELTANTKKQVNDYNNNLAIKLINNFPEECKLIENKVLDKEQINAIIRNNKNQLVIAGAGSGKTTTIVGKVKYLLLTNQYRREDILLLSFTNASAQEMKERILKETNLNLDVMTFHKLGLEIIKNSHNNEYKIFNKDLSQTVKEIINTYQKNPSYLNKLNYFISTARFNIKDEFDFTNENEYKEYLSANKPTTYNGELVKSYGELEIANYLFSNNVSYIYEQEYVNKTINSEYQQYYPDFYLPEYNIYIEYFGIDEHNQVAPYFKGKHGLSASDAYNESITWKRKIHEENNTIMIETFYYEMKQGNLIINLENNLKKYGVKLIHKSEAELWETINKNNNGVLNEICNVFATIISLIKSNDYLLEYIESLPEIKYSYINKLTLDLITPIYNNYQNKLKEENAIDFNDMINIANNDIINNNFLHKYKYVIVDEYQDMSISRFKLLKSIRKQNDYKLFCVGDDWQSIYRFNGSDIDLITNFEKYWGNTYISYIEKTYRFTSIISYISSKFIMKNPKQYKKAIIAKPSNDFAIKFINGYTEKNCLDFLEKDLIFLDKNSTVFFLGRYSFDINIIKNNNNFIIKYNTSKNTTDIIYTKRLDLKIEFLTIHKSKGLQADYVILLNNKNNGMGFPSKINDLPIIKVLLSNGLNEYPDAEERRLFYVALTRAKKKVILLTVKNNESTFIKEIEKDYNYLIKADDELKRNLYTCPECGGKLITRKGPYGTFLGCNNYPNCKYSKNK